MPEPSIKDFEAAIAELESIVKKLEEGDLPLEQSLTRDAPAGRFCHGDSPGMADVLLVPQVFNARRFAVDLAAYPRIAAIDAACRDIPAFADAAPERQS